MTAMASAAVRVIARYAWQANKQGGQTIGNLEEIRSTDEDGECASYISQDGGATWRLFRVREFDELRPAPYKFERGWVIAVTDFGDPEVRRHIQSADQP